MNDTVDIEHAFFFFKITEFQPFIPNRYMLTGLLIKIIKLYSAVLLKNHISQRIPALKKIFFLIFKE